MNLHTGHVFWPDTLPTAPSYPSLHGELNCEILVVGGGISGALCAYLLAERGIDTILVERGRIAGGSTLASAGLLQYASDKMLTSCIRTFGEEPAVHFYRLSRRALERLKHIGSGLEEAARLTERTSLYLASTVQDAKTLKEECETLQKFGFPAIWWTEDEIASRFPFRYPGGICSEGDAEINPYAFVRGLVGAAAGKGVQIYEQSPVRGHEAVNGGRILCRCGEGSISAKHVIWATGYDTQQFKKDSGAGLTATYAAVTEPAGSFEDWFERCLIWESARPYLYLRTTKDGRILAGGLDESLSGGRLQEGRETHQSQRLLDSIYRLFPAKSGLKAAYAWGAVFGETRDGLPYIGPHPNFPGFTFLEGYGGNGTVCSMIAAEMIVDQLTGTARRDMALFALTRTTKPAPDRTLR
ncbi:NAD(P)/FAD-dependent oxidoreductase [Paenibacillus macerans]|uniref:NAD(P)/FAD-dependent oxidoreductase n=1 Tax=Paenibacillus macerans TaxID=44252 RepID=UPI003D312CF3